MNQQKPKVMAPNPLPVVNGIRYQDLPLEELLRRIAEDIDSDAHDYFSRNCTPFHDSEGEGVCLSTYLIDYLKHKLYDSSKDKVHLAYDLTLNKFFYSPQLYPQYQDQYENKNRVDCMNYYIPLWKEIRVALARKPGLDPYEREMLVARMVQRFVDRHCSFSIKEAERRLFPSTSRYCWHVKGGVMSLYFPRWFSGKCRNKWLERNINDADRTPSHREQVQKLIDKRLKRGCQENLDNESVMAASWQAAAKPQTKSSRGPIPLATAIAQEMVDKIDRLQPAVCYLGPQRLFLLILRIFSDLLEGPYQAKKISRDFFITEVTYARWAGARWRNKTDTEMKIPELWVNLAEFLVDNLAEFREAAKKVGVWKKVKHIAADHIVEVRHGA